MGRTACSGTQTAGVPDGRSFFVRRGWCHLYVCVFTFIFGPTLAQRPPRARTHAHDGALHTCRTRAHRLSTSCARLKLRSAVLYLC